MKESGEAIARAANMALNITGAQTFDFDHLGTLVSQQRAS
ncbi:MAG: hypothetical protein ACJAYE_003125 [Candidatus Azotimanducaceae bacterium]|jgi:hypothetical protein